MFTSSYFENPYMKILAAPLEYKHKIIDIRSWDKIKHTYSNTSHYYSTLHNP